MRLGQGVEWALHCCVVLGALPGGVLPAAKLAEFHDVPPAYLAKHLQALAHAGIVESVPGPKGGYRLARAAADVSVLDVVLAVEGDERAFACTEIRQRGPAACDPALYTKACGIARVMWEAESAWRNLLADCTIAQLIDGVLQESPAQGQEAVVVWIGGALR